MKKKSTLIIIAVIAVLAMWGISSYNGLVEQEESVKQVWGNVESSYQRRADLIPNLVSVVKGYAKHEENTLKEVIEARSKATAVTINADDLNEETMKKFQDAQSQVGSALSRLMVVAEQYPELKANENYAKTMDAVNTYENQVRMSRMTYNDTVTKYNKEIRQFPPSLVAGVLGFSTREYLNEAVGKTEMPSMKI